MELILDCIQTYLGAENAECSFRLRVYEDAATPTVVVASELPQNTGATVTNLAERLAWQVWLLLEQPARGMLWIEHYPKECRAECFDDSFTLVQFTDKSFQHPHWRPLTREAVEALIGQPVDA